MSSHESGFMNHQGLTPTDRWAALEKAGRGGAKASKSPTATPQNRVLSGWQQSDHGQEHTQHWEEGPEFGPATGPDWVDLETAEGWGSGAIWKDRSCFGDRRGWAPNRSSSSDRLVQESSLLGFRSIWESPEPPKTVGERVESLQTMTCCLLMLPAPLTACTQSNGV